MAGRHGAVKGVCDPCALIPRSVAQGRIREVPRPVSTTTRARDVPHGARLAVIALTVVAVVAGGLLVVRALSPADSVSSGPPVALDPPRLIEEAAEAGIEHTYAGDYPYFVGGGVAAFDCDDDGRPDLYLAGGEGNAALYRNRSEVGGALRFDAAGGSLDGPGIGDRRVPDRHRRRRLHRSGRAPTRRGRDPARPRRLPVRAGQRALAFDGGDGWTVGFSATWETPAAALPTLAFGDYLTLDGHGERHERMRGRPARPTCDVGHRRTPSAVALHAELVHAVDAVQRLGPVGPARSARLQRSPLLPGRRGAAVADRARQAAAALHARRWLGAPADLGHGHRQRGPDRRRLPGGLPDEPGRQQAPDPGRRPDAAALRGHRAASRGDRPQTRMPAASHCRRRPGIRRSRTSTTTASPTCTSARATSTPRPTTPRRTRATC